LERTESVQATVTAIVVPRPRVFYVKAVVVVQGGIGMQQGGAILDHATTSIIVATAPKQVNKTVVSRDMGVNHRSKILCNQKEENNMMQINKEWKVFPNKEKLGTSFRIEENVNVDLEWSCKHYQGNCIPVALIIMDRHNNMQRIAVCLDCVLEAATKIYGKNN